MPIQRHFIDWNQPVLPAVADLLIDRYATADQLDLRNLVMVFTGSRAARRMLELLLEKASTRWPAFMPPRMVTFQRFPELLYPQQQKLADELTQLLVWKKALSAIPAAELTAALPAIPSDEAVPSWMSLCESLRSQHNELAEEGMEFDEVAAALLHMGNHSEAARWKALRRIQSEYLVQMDGLGQWDREAARLVAVQKQECHTDADIMLVGTVDINRVVKQMLDQVASRVTAVVHAPASESESFDEYGCLVPAAWTERRLDIPVDATRIAEDPEGQAVLAVGEIAALDGTRRADEIAVGIADESLVAAVLQRFADAGISGRWPVGLQLKDTRPYRALTGITDHLSSARDGQPPDFATLSDLVRHPDVHRWVDRFVRKAVSGKQTDPVDWLSELDRYIAVHLQSCPGVLLGKRDRQVIVGAIISAVEQLLGLLCPDFVGQNTPSGGGRRKTHQQQQSLFDDQIAVVSQSLQSQLAVKKPVDFWARGIIQLTAALYGEHEFQPDNVRDRGISECFDALTDASEFLRNIPAAVMPKCTAAQAIQLLLKQIAESPIPPESDDQAVDLLRWLELPMDDSPVLILTGFNEGFLPESITSDVFLPNSFRTQLGLRDNHRRYARDAYALTALTHSREQIVYIAGRTDAKGNPLTPSRLWFAADPDSLPARVQRFYDSTPATSADHDSEAVAEFAETPAGIDETARLSGFTLPRPSMIPDVPAEIPVTAFREYLYCPYRYFLKRELKLKSIEDETLELEAQAFGSLMHDVLNEFGQSDYAHATHPEPIETFLLKTLQGLSNKRFGRNRSATIAVQLQMMQDRLSAFARWQAQTAAEGWRIHYTEEDLKFTDFKDKHRRGVVLAGRVDRVDQHQTTEQWRVLDYKTSERAEKPEATHMKKGEWIDLQLPLYRLLVQSLGIDGEIQLGYVHLPGDLSSVGASIAKWSDAELETAEETAREVAANIMDLRIDQVTPGQERRATEFARVCQDSVIDRNIPWLDEWLGRAGE
ncbi:MAG TPA: PD-(D/E)XK nuclease family protein [Planctomycetes bacterium]|nr:PD-(D/E)XK nuclease family protein [Planctomycetota bacterium]